jgi:hypothetical protein
MNHYRQKAERYKLLEHYARRRLAELTDWEIYQLVIPDRAEPVIETAIDQMIQLVKQMRTVLETLVEQAALLHAVYSVPSKADAYEQARLRFSKYPPYMMREYRDMLAQIQQELEIDTIWETLMEDKEFNHGSDDNDDNDDTQPVG